MPSLVVIGQQIKETWRGHNVPPAYIVRGGGQLAQILGRYVPQQNQKVDP